MRIYLDVEALQNLKKHALLDISHLIIIQLLKGPLQLVLKFVLLLDVDQGLLQSRAHQGVLLIGSW